MKTDDLILLLSTGIEPVDRHAARRRLAGSVLLGVAGAALLLALCYGTRGDLRVLTTMPAFWLKVALPLSLWISALAISARLARPGASPHRLWLGIAGPAVAAWIVGTLVLLAAPPDTREAMLLGRTWRTCSIQIAVLALPALGLMLWAIRGLAPTHLRLSGAMAGLFAGATGALAYCLHCPEMQVPFWATWYIAGMSIPTLAGALLGPLALRW